MAAEIAPRSRHTRQPLAVPSGAWERRGLVNGLATLLVSVSACSAVLVLLLMLGHVPVQGLPALTPASASRSVTSR